MVQPQRSRTARKTAGLGIAENPSIEVILGSPPEVRENRPRGADGDPQGGMWAHVMDLTRDVGPESRRRWRWSAPWPPVPSRGALCSDSRAQVCHLAATQSKNAVEAQDSKLPDVPGPSRTGFDTILADFKLPCDRDHDGRPTRSLPVRVRSRFWPLNGMRRRPGRSRAVNEPPIFGKVASGSRGRLQFRRRRLQDRADGFNSRENGLRTAREA